MNIHKLALALAASCLLAAGCVYGSISIRSCNGTVVTGSYSENGGDWSEERQTGTFSGIKSTAPFNVHFIQGDTWRVLVDGKQEFVEKTTTKVVDDRLVIGLENGKYTDLVLKVTVQAPDIREFLTTGCGELFVDGPYETNGDLKFQSQGSGDFYAGDLFCNSLSVSLSGSGDFEAERIDAAVNASFRTTGSGDFEVRSVAAAANLELSSAGAGDYAVGDAICNDLTITTSGSGDFEVQRIDAATSASLRTSGSGDIAVKTATIGADLDLSSSGSGDIEVNGSCRKVSAKTNGSGDIYGRIRYESSNLHSSGSGDINL